MMSGATIAAMSESRTGFSTGRSRAFYGPDDLRDWKAELEAGRYPRLLPFIGSRNPRGWKKKAVFWDSSALVSGDLL